MSGLSCQRYCHHDSISIVIVLDLKRIKMEDKSIITEVKRIAVEVKSIKMEVKSIAVEVKCIMVEVKSIMMQVKIARAQCFLKLTNESSSYSVRVECLETILLTFIAMFLSV